MKKTKILITAMLVAVATVGAFASMKNSQQTLWYYINANETGPTSSDEFEVVCPEPERGCIVPIPELGGQERQLFLDEAATLPIAPEV